jgi:dihydropteroate synthase
MGVLNVTPDSFSDGGRYYATEIAVQHALEMVEHGADFIDVGGESTRPKSQAYREGADAVSAEEELRRVLPVIEQLRDRTSIPISIDTYKSQVAERALQAGAVIVNDISGFTVDPRMPEVVAEAGASAVLMHIKGTPKTMQQNPHYDDLFGEVTDFLRKGLTRGEEVGVQQMIVDPGIGFGKRQDDNLQLIAGLSRFTELGRPILIGPSRKTFIGNILDLPVEERLEGTLAAVVACILNGANIIRVHDVKETKRAAMVADTVKSHLPNIQH